MDIVKKAGTDAKKKIEEMSKKIVAGITEEPATLKAAPEVQKVAKPQVADTIKEKTSKETEKELWAKMEEEMAAFDS